MSLGMLSKNEGLDGSYVNTICRTLKAATHYAGYDNAHIVVLMHPDFDRMNSRQFNAILDHVARGGTLVFGDPEGAMAAWETPLRKCMPVTPLRLRQLEHLTALTAIGGKDVFWPKGRTFLESVPRGDGVTTLAHDDFPLLRWGRYGLGKVGVCALNPSLPGLQKDGRRNFNAYWRHLLSFGGRVSYASSTRDPGLTEAVDKLTGIKIPPAGAIRIMIICYIGVILTCVILGFVLKQHVKSWIGLGLVALVSTWAVFMYARYRQRALAPRTATVLEFTNYGSEDKSTEQLVSLVLKRDQTLDLKNDNVDLLLRSFPPPVKERKRRKAPDRSARPTPPTVGKTNTPGPDGKPAGKKTKPGQRRRNDMFGESRKGEDEELRDPLKVYQTNGRGSLDNLLLQDGKPMFFGCLATASGTDIADLPVVKWLPTGPQIEAWTFPESIDPKCAILVCENGCFLLTIKGGALSLKDGKLSRMDSVSPEYASLANFLTRTLTPAPFLVLFTIIKEDATGFLNPPGSAKDDAFDMVGRGMHMIPIVEDLTTEEITIPFGRIRLTPANASARVLKTNGRYTDLTPSKNAFTGYTLNCFLPPAHSKMEVVEIVVDFVPENRGKNIEFKLGVRGENFAKDKELPMERRSDGKYAIALTADQWQQIIDKSSGQFQIVLSCKPKRILKDHLARIRENTWKVTRLRVSARGTLPPEHRGRL